MLVDHPDQGLVTSLAVYIIAIAFGLVVIVVPVLLFNGPTKFHNPGVAAYNPPAGTLLIPVSDRNSFPLALLKQEDIAAPTQIAARKVKSDKPEKAPRLENRGGHRVSPKAPSENTRYALPTNNGRWPFSFF